VAGECDAEAIVSMLGVARLDREWEAGLSGHQDDAKSPCGILALARGKSGPPMIYIVIRRTTDWGNEAVVHAQLPEEFGYCVALWNTCFALPYHIFRQELARIAQINRSRITGALCVPRAEVPAGAIVVPSDDDDWFVPELAATLETASEGRYSGYYWPSEFIEVPISLSHRFGLIRRAIFPRTPPKWRCTTNNYALRMSPAVDPLIDNHMSASHWFVAHPASVRRLEHHLSVMNRTLASQTSLAGIRSGVQLMRKFRRYRRVYRRPLNGTLAWCGPYVAMMRDLMEALPRRR